MNPGKHEQPEHIPEQTTVGFTEIYPTELSRPEIAGHNLVKLEMPALTDAIENAFDIDVSDLKKVESGFASQVYQATSGGETVFILINADTEIYPVGILGYKLFNEQGIPTPRVIGYRSAPTAIGHPTLILSAAEGELLADAERSPEAKAHIYEELGQMMHKMHTIHLEGYGPLKAREGELVGDFKTLHESWRALQERFERETVKLKELKLLTNEEIEALKAVNAEVGAIEIEHASFLHTDLHKGHVFVTGDRISGIIDLGRIRAGDPRADIAESRIFQKPADQEAFNRGYGELAKDPMIDKYMLLICASKILFRYKIGNQKGLESVTKTFRKTLVRIREQV